ncbi:universal stress protein [Robertmurraya andreesenii]|uniref:Nucleotide-binding universal stress UspA family protein n=1 Tax=Anoxybacillus andreesenii TaxID=1325932 RepID=A0ABT9V5Q9_9BACL|nr:universal stress protein [Robertmurraya andreesenii]MDQ0156274.1 nucleotide-binding universal stress UspA family protein [Robertmurraya andreesenii]
MIFSNILVPFDGSELAMKSLEKAIEFAKLDRTVKVTALHAYQLPIKRVPDAIFNPVKNMIMEDAHATIEPAKKKLEVISEQSEAMIVEGAPIKVILEKAEELNCDVIIMGSRGLSGIKEFLGSISHYISQHSPIPLLLIK